MGDNYGYCNSWKSDNIEREKEERSKEIIQKLKKIKSDNFTRTTREKLNLHVQY